ncbi:nuclear transport factor 2 family protein [Marivita sp. S0852]|uniref:nuclear transport factor 2 family protein n=1 Tax=Marivita sp. S0852 TaxID=3373893 RepID=UPI003981AB64
MDKQDIQDWLDQYGQAWVEGDPQQIVGLFTNDATYQETPFVEAMVGHAAIKKYWQEGASDAQEDVEFTSKVWAVDGDTAVAGWEAKFTRKASGARVELNGAFRLKLRKYSERLLCESLEEWWHRREI